MAATPPPASRRSAGEIASQMDALAELVAEGASISAAGNQLGMSEAQTSSTWRAIVREMGAQAV